MSQRDGAQPEAPASLGAADKLLLLKSLHLDSAQRDSVQPSRRWLLPAGIAAGVPLAVAPAGWALRPPPHPAGEGGAGGAPPAGGKEKARAPGYPDADPAARGPRAPPHYPAL